MKRKVIAMMGCLILIFFVFICCEYEECELCDIEVGEMYDYVCEECDEIKINDINPLSKVPITLQRIYLLSHYMFKYNYIDEKKDYWKLPEEFYNNKGGDCEDFSIFAMYILKMKYNINSKLVLIILSEGLHTIIHVENKYYFDILNNELLNKKDLKIKWECPYGEIIWMTYYYHDNVGQYR